MENNNIVKYKTDKGEQITLSPQIVRQYLINGDGAITEQEIQMFLRLCQYQGLNPFTREIYLIKYGNNPATMVTGKEAFTKRAERHPDYRGQEAGIYVVTSEGKVHERKGTMTLPGDQVIGGWAKIYREGYKVPIEYNVSFNEYAGRKKDGSLNQQWSRMPATMIRKVALVAALREAFPAEFGGMYDADEINTIDSAALPRDEITPNDPTIIEHTVDVDYEVVADLEPNHFTSKMGQRRADQYDSFKNGEMQTEVLPQTYHCEDCGAEVTQKVAKYSVGKFNHIFCMADQKKHAQT